MTFGQRLKARRLQLPDPDVKRVAARAGIPWGKWYEWERDKCKPGIERLPQIAAALGCHAADLLTDEPAREEAAAR